jgi:hypothetical protein
MAGKKLLPDKFKAVTRYRYGLLKTRPKDVPHITASSYGYVLTRWKQFDSWNDWKDKPAGTPRPIGVWKTVPPWDGWTPWDLRKEILKHRPAPTPPKIIQPPTPPIPPIPAWAAWWQRCLYAGMNPLLGMSWRGCKVLFTADPSYDSAATKASADQLRSAGHDIGVWYVPTQVSLDRAVEVARRLGVPLEHISGQAETLPEFWQSWENGHKHVCGNLSDTYLDAAAADLIRTGKMAYTNEFYWNQDKDRKPNNRNLPVVSMLIACYDGHSDSSSANAWEPSAQDYKDAGYWWNGMGLYEPGADVNDAKIMP